MSRAMMATGLTPCACVISALLVSVGAQADDDTYFDPRALQVRGGAKSHVDLSSFNRGAQLPGTYRVDIYLNDEFTETRDVRFINDGASLVPELTAGYWQSLGLKPGAAPDLEALPLGQVVSAPGHYIENASAILNFRKMRLDVSIPQAALAFRARDYVSPELWDQGLPALLLNYDLNYNSTRQRQSGGEYNSLFLRLDGGLNLGAWRLRNNSTFTRNTGEQPAYDDDGNRIIQTSVDTRWQSLNTWVQRDVSALGAQLTLGEYNTPGDLFDSIAFTGAQLSSDDSMLPDSLRGFAPVVRGIARSSAQVTVRQNGAVIYQTQVAAGAFEIRDLYPTSSSGNLDVTIREADGNEQSFVQPFSAVPGMQREGHLRYSATAGRYRSYSGNTREPDFLQGTLQYGLANTTTVYGGVIAAGQYQSALAGVGQGLGIFGSLSIDVTQAETTLDGSETRSGQSFRAQYAKDIRQSGTSFVLAGYRYSTSGFYDFTEANEIGIRGGDDGTPEGWRRTHNKRSRMQAQITQQLGDAGNLSLTAYQQDYWGNSGSERTLMAGYSINYAGVSYAANLSDTRYPNSIPNRSLYLSVSVPLDRWLSGSRATWGLSADSRNRIRNQIGLSGLALDNRLSYGFSEGYATRGEGNSGALNAQYRGARGNLSAGYSYNQSSVQLNGGFGGGLVVHPYGVTLSQPLGDTLALVQVPGAGGVGVKNQRGVQTDGRGYAVVPYLTAYRKNSVMLETDTLPDDVDLDKAAQTVIPTRGALVLAGYKANVGARVLANVSFHGQPVPFGATVSLMVDGENSSNSFVGDNGDVYLSGVPEKRKVQVKVQWGKGAGQQCSADVSLKPLEPNSRFRNANIICR